MAEPLDTARTTVCYEVDETAAFVERDQMWSPSRDGEISDLYSDPLSIATHLTSWYD